jgi:hypothetical protein
MSIFLHVVMHGLQRLLMMNIDDFFFTVFVFV